MKSGSFAIAALCLFTVAACGPGETDRTRIRNAIEAMALAIQEGEPGPFTQRVAEDFSGNRGSWDRHRVRQYVLAQTIRRAEAPAIDLSIRSIELFGDRARATVEATIRGGGRLIPAGGARYRFETGWRRDDGEWLVIRADWERLDR